MNHWRLFFISLALLVGYAPQSRAQIPVVDFASLVQLVTQVQTLESQLDTARNQLAQAESALGTMTGSRGMQLLLGSTVRNYLPPDWAGFASATSNSNASYAALGAALQSALQANSVLTPQMLAAFSPQDAAGIASARQNAALLQVSSQQSLSRTSGQFDSLQQLITAIGSTTDQKSILELVARIAAEQAMVQNEQTKIQVLRQALDGQEWVRQQQTLEQAVAAQGSFATRFQPTPP
jgi:type IV secretion system protein VirB5